MALQSKSTFFCGHPVFNSNTSTWITRDVSAWFLHKSQFHFLFSTRSRGWSTWAPRCAARLLPAPSTPASTCRGCCWCPGWPLAALWGQLRGMCSAHPGVFCLSRNYLWQGLQGGLKCKISSGMESAVKSAFAHVTLLACYLKKHMSRF